MEKQDTWINPQLEVRNAGGATGVYLQLTVFPLVNDWRFLAGS